METGEKHSRYFIDLLRKQFLIWSSLSAEEKGEYIKNACARITE